MVSFWPFSREDASSPKSFEKTLATLSDKIQRLQIRGDTLRALHRRVKVLFTLYSSFVYVAAFLILVLVTGYQNWAAPEWTGLAGSPVAILGIRYLIDLYFDWREENVRSRLEKKSKERDIVIKKLKDAMRYDSTKELLDKYGGSGGRGTPAKQPNEQAKKSAKKPQQQRTGFAPPPTANIPGRITQPQNAIDAKLKPQEPAVPTARNVADSSTYGESFAPNAYTEFERPRPAAKAVEPKPDRPSFLDRILDLIVGEDESDARNRIVLLCTTCKTVNGQAPPGTRSLAELGRWRCGACGAWNGVEGDSDKIIEQAKADVAAERYEPSSAVSAPAAMGEQSEIHLDDDSESGHDNDEAAAISTT